MSSFESRHQATSLELLLMDNLNARRNFLRFAAASPLIATPAVASSIAALLASAPGAGACTELRRAARRERRDRLRRHHHGSARGAQRLRVRAGREEGLVRPGRADALGLPRERRGRRRDARHQPHRVREVQHPRPAPDRRAQGRHQREDLRRDLGQPDLLLPGEQPRRLQRRRPALPLRAPPASASTR